MDIAVNERRASAVLSTSIATRLVFKHAINVIKRHETDNVRLEIMDHACQ